MEIRKLIPYVVQGLAVGIVAGFLLMMIFETDEQQSRPVVEIKEAEPDEEIRRSATLTQGTLAPPSYAPAVENAAPSVVNIYTTKVVTRQPHPLFDDPAFRRFFGDSPILGPRQRLENSLGSGVILSEAGYVLTNNHVISEADEILVALRDGRSAKATVVGTDPETDLAVLKIPEDNIHSITIGRSEELHIGDVVLAIGNPFGVGQTVTMGIVSATGRSQLGISTFENFIQTDAAINPGNSGGALINTAGHLVGINTAIFSDSGGSQGIGFAIPVSLAKMVMQQIIEHGRVSRGWLGIEVQDVTPELAESFNLDTERGVIIAGVLPGGPAEEAGLVAGDVITHVNEAEISNSRQLINVIAGVAPKNSISLTVTQKQKKRDIEAVVGSRPKPRARN